MFTPPVHGFAGSSPLTRGKPRLERGSPGEWWLIPAHAGKTLGAFLAPIIEQGSSPLTRGKRRASPLLPGTPGLIPAHAGKTSARSRRMNAPRAHPRSRGENSRSHLRVCAQAGSSPLTRGKHDARLAGEILEGLIPAHAGKTARMGTTRVRRRAHPRSRGENRSVTSRSPSTRGSSPLTRGKPLRVRQAREREGLIPAHAGKTWG